MSETTTSYGDNNINILSPAPAAGTGGALLLDNDKALSDAIDTKLSLSGGTMTGGISFGSGPYTASIGMGGYGGENFILSTSSGTRIQTINNILDDGGGNVTIGGTLLVNGAITGNLTGNASSATAATTAATASALSGSITESQVTNLTSHLTSVKGITIDGGGTVIPTGVVGSFQIPFNATVTGWKIVSTDGTSGSIAFDVQTCALGSGVYTNTSGNSIIGSTGSPIHPNLTSQTTNSSTSFTNWTSTSLTAGNYLVFAVTGTPASVLTVRLELTLAPR